MEIDLLYVQDCPNRSLARAQIDSALARTGLAALIRENEVRTSDEAGRLGMRGSPTILINGQDPFVATAGATGLACRLYPSEAGLTGAPTVEELIEALVGGIVARTPGATLVVVNAQRIVPGRLRASTADASGQTRVEVHPKGAKLMVSVPDLLDDADLSESVVRAVRRIATAGFQALWRGRLVTLPELLGGDRRELAEAAEHLRLRGRIELSDDGHLIAVHGLCRRSTQHQIEHHDRVVNTWCALDAIGIPAALVIDACARTKCPTCQSPLAVRLSAGEPHALPEAVLWYPEVACGHLVEDFCSGANLFCTIDHLDHWAGGTRGPGRAMTLEEVADVGREVWADVRDPVMMGGEA